MVWTEAEDIKKRWQKYTEVLYKKGLLKKLIYFNWRLINIAVVFAIH